MANVELSGSALVTAVSEMVNRDNSAELAHQKQKVAGESNVRKDQHARMADLLQDARKLQEKAQAAAAHAAGSGKLASLCGIAAMRQRDAAKIANQAAHVNAQAQEAQLAAKTAADKAADSIDKIKATLDTLDAAKNDVESMQAANDRLSKTTLQTE